MKLLDPFMRNFDMLTKSFGLGDVCLAACKEKTTGKTVAVICAVKQLGNDVELVPYAKMLEGDPYAQYEPPSVNDEERTVKAGDEDAAIRRSELEEWVARTFAGRNDDVGYMAATLLHATQGPALDVISIGVRGRTHSGETKDLTLNVRREALKRDHVNLTFFLNELVHVTVTPGADGDILIEPLARSFSEEDLLETLWSLARRAVWYVTTMAQDHRRRT